MADNDSTPESVSDVADFDRPERRIKMNFKLEEELEYVDDRIRQDVSAIASTGRTVFAACDETSTVERLIFDEDAHEIRAHRDVPLGEVFDLPAGPGGEMDIEGMEIDGGYLWITGSHSLKREKPEVDGDPAEAQRRMAELDYDLNRSFLGRLPLVEREEGIFEPLGRIEPVDADAPDRIAACMKMDDDGGTKLKEILAEDPLLAPFMNVPCKENGFDIEGLAVRDDRVLLGLRGPVVGGFAVVVELRVKLTKKGWLKPRKLASGRRYRLHLFELGGLGVRDLLLLEDDLLLLAGPTTDIDGLQPLFRARDFAATGGPSVVEADRLDRVLEIPFQLGAEHAEGIATLDTPDGPRLMVAYDTPADERLDEAKHALEVDLYEMDFA